MKRSTPERNSIRRLLQACTSLGLAWLAAGPAAAISGIEGTFEYAFDAPWRIEPSRDAIGRSEWGDIPIQLSIHDANQAGLDADLHEGETPGPISLGRFCEVTVYETLPSGLTVGMPFDVNDLSEIEATYHVWQWPVAGVPRNEVCRQWEGDSCRSMRDLSGTSEWHALLWYPMRRSPVAGDEVPLQIEMELTRDPDMTCTAAGPDDTITLVNSVQVTLAEAPLPRFSDQWLYGDLHYHSQGTDNEGESAYNYRGVVRAMGAMGVDFVFATEHASNSDQIVDADVSLALQTDLHEADSYSGVLRDMSPERFRFLQERIRQDDGVNREAAREAARDRAPQGYLSHDVVPQLFLGGEVDVIPETATAREPGDPYESWFVPYGNGLNFNLLNLCGGYDSRLEQGDPCNANSFIFEETSTGYLIHDVQGINDEDYGRLHLVYLPRTDADDAFVSSDTGPYGGASRRLTQPHQGRPPVAPEIEEHGYAFIAHHMSAPSPGGSGPDGIPWTDHLLEQAFASPAILGLEFWNEDTRLFHKLEKEDEAGYERPDSDLPTDGVRKGFYTGLFDLWPWDDASGLWGDAEKDVLGVSDQIEATLAHGAYSWDRINLWGLDPRRTRGLDWLGAGEPRRFFMAGGSDAHGDFNYRREGYFLGNTRTTDTAIAKPRNLVYVGRPDVTLQPGDLPELNEAVNTTSSTTTSSTTTSSSTTSWWSSWSSYSLTSSGSSLSYWAYQPPEPPPPVNPAHEAAAHTQEQIVDAIASGHFSVTDGPALRIAVDRNRNGVIDRGDTPMGATVELFGDDSLPLLAEWESTPEFGAVKQIEIYVGVHADDLDPFSEGRLYAPRLHGPRAEGVPGDQVIESYWSQGRSYERMEDDYWKDPTGVLRVDLGGGALSGRRAFELDLGAYEVEPGRRGERFFVRAVAETRQVGICHPAYEDGIRSGACINRYAYANPVWAIQQDFEYCPDAGHTGIDGDGNGLPDACDSCVVAGVNYCSLVLRDGEESLVDPGIGIWTTPTDPAPEPEPEPTPWDGLTIMSDPSISSLSLTGSSSTTTGSTTEEPPTDTSSSSLTSQFQGLTLW